MVWKTNLAIILTSGFLLQTNAGMQYANVSGDLILGGLFPIHGATHDGKCGKIGAQDGIQALEAAVMTLKEVNEKVLPGFTLGLLGMDTCETYTVALENTLEFVKADSVPLTMKHLSHSFTCADGSNPVFNTSSTMPVRQKVVGVVGAAFSEVSIAVASFLRLFQVPQISYWSTSPELSDSEKFKFFKRTVPSDTFQARAVMEILKQMEWRYVSVIYETTSYGTNLYYEMDRIAPSYGICFGYVQKLNPTSKTAVKDIVLRLKDKTNLNGKIIVVLITHMNSAFDMFKAVGETFEENTVHWVGVDAWSGRQFKSKVMGVVDGAIAIQPLARKLEGFDKFFTSLTPHGNAHDPWFKEYWEDHFNCSLENINSSVSCYANMLGPENGYKQLQSLYYVRDAVSVFAEALLKMHQDHCAHIPGICADMRTNLTGEKLLEYLGKVHFKDSLGHTLSFVNGTDGPPRYSVQLNEKGDWKEIGNYTETSPGSYTLYMEKLLKYEESICSTECDIGYERRDRGTCCWSCNECFKTQFVSEETFQCQSCQVGHTPNIFRNSCIAIEEEFIFHSNPWAIFASSIAALGITMCIIAGLIYLLRRKTPIAKASGLELSFVLLFGLLLAYAATFVFVAKPTMTVCAATRFLLGTCYTIFYATIFTKTNRIYRIFSLQTKTRKTTTKRFTSSRSCLVMTFLITILEILGVCIWLYIAPPHPVQVEYTLEGEMRAVLVCSDGRDLSYLFVLIYPFLILVGCVYLAVKTRKTPDGFKETKFIAFSSYSTLILWFAFIPLYFSTSDNTIRVMALCLSLSMNASVILGLLFYSKIYVILLRPQKNTKERVMSRASVSCDGGVDPDRISNLSRMSRPVSSFTLDEGANKHPSSDMNKQLSPLDCRRDLQRMSSGGFSMSSPGGFSMSSPGIQSLGLSLAASQMIAQASSNAESNNSDDNVNENNNIQEETGETYKEIPQIHVNNVKIS